MKKALIFILLVLASPVFSQTTAIAVFDFNVNSEKSEYRFLRKVFSQFLLAELSQVPELTLVEREKRNDIINEIKFGLSGFADNNSLVKLGFMLQSDYMLAGEIFDMAGTLIVTGRLIDIENSSVVAQIGVEV
jgi:TolB-like protein